MDTRVRHTGETRPLGGHISDIKVTSREADDRFCILEGLLPTGPGPRLHRHERHVETWFVLEGELEVHSGNERIPAPAGSFVLVPPGSPHTFGNAGPNEVRMLSFHAPGGLDHFYGELIRFQTQEPRFGEVGDLMARYGTYGAEDVPADVPVVVTLPGEGEHLAVGGGSIRILADSDATGGMFAVVDYTAPPGFPGPPPHRHRELADIFYVLEGELAMELDGETLTAGPGTLAVVAPGTVHRFANPSDRPLRFLGIVAPGGFEQYFRELAATVGDGPVDPTVVGPIVARYDYEAA